MSASDPARLARLNAKGWQVYQLLQRLKARQEVDLSQLSGLSLDQPGRTQEERLRAWLDQINVARRRMGTAQWGRCLDCDHVLPEASLDEMPWLERCQRCDADQTHR